GMEIALATIVGLALQAIATDKMIAGFDQSKAIFIMSAEHEQIAEYIMKKIGRGVTYLEGEGAYLHQRRRVVYAVITLPQLSRLKYYVESVDSNAFLVVADVTEVKGHGFRAIPI
ncbi:MAG: YitT family protein, partial [Gammaproteobacteria bacterium]|nr:YitT family protein [Gammaproteobacteria bacterium]